MHWHFLRTPPDRGVLNMARDEALMRWTARTGDAAFRVYGWSEPTLSLGRNQRARGCYDLDGARERGIAIVRRPTGGRALLHHREITYSATLPARDAAEAAVAYAFINAVLLDAIERLGAPAAMATASKALAPGLRPCFDAPSAHEIAIGGRKLVGSAQWRHGGALLQHGSILVADDQSWISQLLVGGAPDAPPAATLGEALGREPTLEEGAAVLRAALSGRVGALREFPDAAELDAAAAELAAVYRDDQWTWRR